MGNGEEVALATEKAIENAKKNLIFIPVTKTFSIPHSINTSYGAAHLILRPALLNTGIIAGNSIKKILEISGIKNIYVKQLGSNSILNNAKATILGLHLLYQKIELRKLQSKKNYF